VAWINTGIMDLPKVVTNPGTVLRGLGASIYIYGCYFAGTASRVHFSEDQLETHNAEIALTYDSGDRVDIHLGFLKINHRYHIKFTVKDRLGEKIVADENENVTIFESVPIDDGIYQHVLLSDRDLTDDCCLVIDAHPWNYVWLRLECFSSVRRGPTSAIEPAVQLDLES